MDIAIIFTESVRLDGVGELMFQPKDFGFSFGQAAGEESGVEVGPVQLLLVFLFALVYGGDEPKGCCAYHVDDVLLRA